MTTERIPGITDAEALDTVYAMGEGGKLLPHHAGCIHQLIWSLIVQEMLWIRHPATGRFIGGSGVRLSYRRLVGFKLECLPGSEQNETEEDIQGRRGGSSILLPPGCDR